MSQLRLGRLPDGTRHIVDLGPNTGRIHTTRYAIAGSAVNPTVAGAFVTGASDVRASQHAEAARRYRSRAK